MEGNTQPTITGGKCTCTHHKIVPIAIILIGLTLLFGTFGVLNLYAIEIIIPVLIIVIGGTRLSRGMCKCC